MIELEEIIIGIDAEEVINDVIHSVQIFTNKGNKIIVSVEGAKEFRIGDLIKIDMQKIKGD